MVYLLGVDGGGTKMLGALVKLNEKIMKNYYKILNLSRSLKNSKENYKSETDFIITLKANIIKLTLYLKNKMSILLSNSLSHEKELG